jgi:hypothetical protein
MPTNLLWEMRLRSEATWPGCGESRVYFIDGSRQTHGVRANVGTRLAKASGPRYTPVVLAPWEA